MRLGYVTTLAAAMGLLALLAVACSSEESDGYSGADGGGYRGAGCDEYTSAPEVAPVLPSSGLEEPEQEWVTRTESDELRLILATPDLAPGSAQVRDGVD